MLFGLFCKDKVPFGEELVLEENKKLNLQIDQLNSSLAELGMENNKLKADNLTLMGKVSSLDTISAERLKQLNESNEQVKALAKAVVLLNRDVELLKSKAGSRRKSKKR